MNTKFKFFSFSVFFLFCSLLASGQKGTVSGVITGNNGQPLSFAVVQIYHEHDSAIIRGAITDEKGIFVLSDLAADRYYLRASYMGYQPFVSNVFQVKDSGATMLGNLLMTSSNKQLTEVIVKGQRATFWLRHRTHLRCCSWRRAFM